MAVLGPMMEKGSTPEAIAQVVYAATIDETDQLRFEAGADALEMLASRSATEDATLFKAVKAQFGLQVKV